MQELKSYLFKVSMCERWQNSTNNQKMGYDKVKECNLLQRGVTRKVYTEIRAGLIIRSLNCPTTRFASAWTARPIRQEESGTAHFLPECNFTLLSLRNGKYNKTVVVWRHPYSHSPEQNRSLHIYNRPTCLPSSLQMPNPNPGSQQWTSCIRRLYGACSALLRAVSRHQKAIHGAELHEQRTRTQATCLKLWGYFHHPSLVRKSYSRFLPPPHSSYLLFSHYFCSLHSSSSSTILFCLAPSVSNPFLSVPATVTTTTTTAITSITTTSTTTTYYLPYYY